MNPDVQPGFINHKGHFLDRVKALDYAREHDMLTPAAKRYTNSEGAMLGASFIRQDAAEPSLVPAVRTADGKIHAGTIGDTHARIIKQAALAGDSGGLGTRLTHGYLTHTGQFLNRQRAWEFAEKHDLLTQVGKAKAKKQPDGIHEMDQVFLKGSPFDTPEKQAGFARIFSRIDASLSRAARRLFR